MRRSSAPRRAATSSGRASGPGRVRSGRVNTRWPPTTTVSLPSMAADRRADLGGAAWLAGERQLGVEHDAPRPAGDGGRRGVEPDAALQPDRGVDGGDQALQQHEGGLLADPPAGFGALGHHAVGVRRRGPPAPRPSDVASARTRRPAARCGPTSPASATRTVSTIRGRSSGPSPAPAPSRTPNGPSWRAWTRAISARARAGRGRRRARRAPRPRHSADDEAPVGTGARGHPDDQFTVWVERTRCHDSPSWVGLAVRCGGDPLVAVMQSWPLAARPPTPGGAVPPLLPAKEVAIGQPRGLRP